MTRCRLKTDGIFLFFALFHRDKTLWPVGNEWCTRLRGDGQFRSRNQNITVWKCPAAFQHGLVVWQTAETGRFEQYCFMIGANQWPSRMHCPRISFPYKYIDADQFVGLKTLLWRAEVIKCALILFLSKFPSMPVRPSENARLSRCGKLSKS